MKELLTKLEGGKGIKPGLLDGRFDFFRGLVDRVSWEAALKGRRVQKAGCSSTRKS